PADDIHQHRQPERSGRLTYLPRRHGFKAVDLDATESPVCDRMLHHLEDSAGIPFRMHESESDEALWITGDDAGQLQVSLPIVAMKRRENHRFVDSSRPRATQVGFDRRVRVPRGGHLVALAGVTVAVDDHALHSLSSRSARPA